MLVFNTQLSDIQTYSAFVPGSVTNPRNSRHPRYFAESDGNKSRSTRHSKVVIHQGTPRLPDNDTHTQGGRT